MSVSRSNDNGWQEETEDIYFCLFVSKQKWQRPSPNLPDKNTASDPFACCRARGWNNGRAQLRVTCHLSLIACTKKVLSWHQRRLPAIRLTMSFSSNKTNPCLLKWFSPSCPDISGWTITSGMSDPTFQGSATSATAHLAETEAVYASIGRASCRERV